MFIFHFWLGTSCDILQSVNGMWSAAADKAQGMYFVYVLESEKDGRCYVGQTSDLQHRLVQHNSGESHYTKNRGPWFLIYSEEYSTRSEAMIRERYLKTGVGRDFLKSLTE